MAKDQRISSINIPRLETQKITDQIEVLVMERHQLPLAAFRLIMWGGSVNDPPGKEGLTRLTGNLLMKGAGDYSADNFAYAVEAMGADLHVSTGYDAISISGEFRSNDVETGLELLSTMITSPRFSEKEIVFSKKKTLSDIIASFDEPGYICSTIHRKNLFGKHPYGNPITGYRTSINRLHKEDVHFVHQQHFLKSRMLLLVCGDVKASKIFRKASELFAEFKTPPADSNTLESAGSIKGTTVYLINKPDQSQAHIRIGNLGIARSDPMFFKLAVTNILFGGSFTSRLMTEIRINQGLTYGIRSTLAAHKYPGSMTIATFTKTESTSLAIELIYKEIQKLHKKSITTKELTATKRYLQGLYPLSLETNKRLLQKLSDVRFFGLPGNSIEDYPLMIDGVSASDVQISADKYYSDSDSVITILGNSEKIAPSVEKIGTIVFQDAENFFSPGTTQKIYE